MEGRASGGFRFSSGGVNVVGEDIIVFTSTPGPRSSGWTKISTPSKVDAPDQGTVTDPGPSGPLSSKGTDVPRTGLRERGADQRVPGTDSDDAPTESASVWTLHCLTLRNPGVVRVPVGLVKGSLMSPTRGGEGGRQTYPGGDGRSTVGIG